MARNTTIVIEEKYELEENEVYDPEVSETGMIAYPGGLLKRTFIRFNKALTYELELLKEWVYSLNRLIKRLSEYIRNRILKKEVVIN